MAQGKARIFVLGSKIRYARIFRHDKSIKPQQAYAPPQSCRRITGWLTCVPQAKTTHAVDTLIDVNTPRLPYVRHLAVSDDDRHFDFRFNYLIAQIVLNTIGPVGATALRQWTCMHVPATVRRFVYLL